MDRVTATLPDSVAELCLLRFGLVARRWPAVPFLRRMCNGAVRWANSPESQEAGLLHSESFRLAWNHAGLLQYWRSFAELDAWSHRTPHSDWWRQINDRIRRKGDIGVYHETFLVPRSSYESIFVNCPPVGGMAFGALGAPTGKMTVSRDRLGRRG